jgi:hypothetical protein
MIEERPNADDYLARAHRAEAALGEALILLDGSVEALEKAAEDEVRQEAGKPMRKITHQSRLAAVLELLGKDGL